MELSTPASDDGTVTMLRQMRDQMERINFKEIQLFDSIIAKMSEKKNAASSKLVSRLKHQGPDLINSKGADIKPLSLKGGKRNFKRALI